MIYVFLALSYLLGATPTSYWVGRAFHGVDLREHGSGNLGATNTYRILGWRSALPVILVDVAKGFVPVWFFPSWCDASFGWILAFGGAAILGHMFSLWVGFRGGKGVGTSAGVFLALAPWAVLGGFLVWLTLAVGTRYVSLASIGAAVTLPAFVVYTPHAGGNGLVWFTVALAVVVVWAHRSNMRRLVHGEENRISRSRSAAGGTP